MILLFLALSLPPDFDKSAFCHVANSIYIEAGKNERAAEKIASARGYTKAQIWLAKKLCRSS